MNFTKTLVLFLGLLSFQSFGQVNPHAIGIRFASAYYSNGAEISYQHGFGDKNRLELDLGGRRHKNWAHIGLAAVFHWDWNITEGLNWYVGPGARIGQYRSKFYDSYGLTLAIGGQIGLEYDFNQHNAPILISLDWRPMWGFYTYSDYDPFGYEGGFSVRYTF
ncbi:hypothetical protein K6119_04785 [Paracrocinitomix mangrovi]|uniref:hypothetical protein n=1 Tax=Paracrocinitomix mangrovi TaxID=2862509 RepID=UPI001C8D50B1|nr:hypothetical protein [Paracrocinitomix mangrovi]UKN02831.1 hypothetical protein K6119_04785 [Paracrocinitomix mangrovi]